MSTEKDIRDFFRHYEERTNKAIQDNDIDVDDVTASFADYFVEASPKGVIGGKNDKEFRKAIPQGYEHYRNIGITAMNIVSMEVLSLDALHAMAKVHWRSDFKRKDDTSGSVAFDVMYFLQKSGDQYKVFAYITGDEQKALEENGLI